MAEELKHVQFQAIERERQLSSYIAKLEPEHTSLRAETTSMRQLLNEAKAAAQQVSVSYDARVAAFEADIRKFHANQVRVIVQILSSTWVS